MTTPPGLILLGHLIDEHDFDRPGPALVACMHEELDKDIELLAAGARRLGGILYDLGCAEAEWEPPKGPISKVRRQVLDGLLTTEQGMLPGVVTITEDSDGNVIASLDDRAASQPSLTVLLRALSVVASSAYDDFDFVALAAPLVGLDPTRRELLWSILTIDVVDLDVRGTATTIVPILGARVDPENDYRRAPAIRYVVRWDRVIRRSAQKVAHAVDTIANRGDRPIVLFLGAGASASAKIRLGNSYRDLALEGLVGRHETSEEAADAFFDLLHERQHFLPGERESRATFVSTLTLERVLRETFIDLGFRRRIESPVIQELVSDCERALSYVRPGRVALRELASKLQGQLIIMTVNFDQLIETDLGVDTAVYFQPDDFKTGLSAVQSYMRSSNQKLPVPVLKLHGSIEDPESLIATIDSTSAGLQDDVRAMLNAILAESAGPLTWVWIGCSMRDRDMNLWLGGLGADALDEWWVDPLPGQALDDFTHHHRLPKWSKIGQQLEDRLIIESSDRFLRALSERVQRL